MPRPILSRFALAALLAVALLASTASAQAPVVLRPGHPDLMTSGLSLGSQVMAVRIAEPAMQDIGTMTYQVDRAGDTVTLVTNSNVPQAGQVSEVTTSFAWPSLRPIERERATSGATSMTMYDGMHVTGTYGTGDWTPLPFDITLQAIPFQPEVMPLLARALPFRAGYIATVPTFTAERRLRDVTLTVIDQEPFARADGSTVQAWVVEETSQGRGSRTQRYYVDPASRDLIATTFEPQKGTRVVTEPTTEAALAEVAANQSAGVPLRPGSDALALDALTSYTQSFVVKVVQPMQQDVGTQTRTVTVDRGAGTVTIEGVTDIAVAGQKSTETLVVAYPSLRPISSRTDNNGTVVELAYTEAGVSRAASDDGEEGYEIAFPEPTFDPSLVFEVVRLLPFEEGYQAAFQTFDPDGLTSVAMTVAGRDEVEGRSVWLVNVQPQEGPPTEFAIDAETRELVRIQIQPQVGVVVQFVRATG